MSGLYLLWAVISDSKSGMLGEVILVIKPGHSRVRTVSEGLSNQPVPSSLNWAGFV
jgi:hypothetical protein